MAQCKAHSSRTGKPCNCQAIQGATVCRNHGGSAPQVKAKAAERLRALVDPAIGVLETTLKQKKRPELSLKAAQDVLDRNGHKQAEKVDLAIDADARFDFTTLSDEQLALIAGLFRTASGIRGDGEAETEQMEELLP